MQRMIRDHNEQLHGNKLYNIDEMEKFLETQNLPRLNHDEINNLNRSSTNKDTESAVKTLSTKQP